LISADPPPDIFGMRSENGTVPPDEVRLARDAASGVEAIQARFAAHAYDLHHHDDWLVGVTFRGVQDFLCRGARQRSTSGRVILIEPGEPHDGQSGSEDGFAYCMLYLPQPWLRAALDGVPGGEPGYRETLCDDPLLAQSVRRACAVLATQEPRLLRDAALDAVGAGLRPHLGRPALLAPLRRDARLARRARDRLHDLVAEEIGADALAAASGAADRFQLARAFRAEFGTSPHAYQVQLRLLMARRLLAGGEAPAAVAAECGFADQSHLGRWFRRAYGLTPASYRAACTGVPDVAAEFG
jgi:AraC-like DNA-binding protein